MAEEINKCAHEGCVCATRENEEYCSPQCEAAGETDTTEIVCECGHQACEVR